MPYAILHLSEKGLVSTVIDRGSSYHDVHYVCPHTSEP
jgi:hypothetical protein